MVNVNPDILPFLTPGPLCRVMEAELNGRTIYVRLTITSEDDPEGVPPLVPTGRPFKIALADLESGETCAASPRCGRAASSASPGAPGPPLLYR